MKTPDIEIKRHAVTMDEKTTAAVVEIVADMVVNYVKGTRSARIEPSHKEKTHEQPLSKSRAC